MERPRRGSTITRVVRGRVDGTAVRLSPTRRRGSTVGLRAVGAPSVSQPSHKQVTGSSIESKPPLEQSGTGTRRGRPLRGASCTLRPRAAPPSAGRHRRQGQVPERRDRLARCVIWRKRLHDQLVALTAERARPTGMIDAPAKTLGERSVCPSSASVSSGKIMPRRARPGEITSAQHGRTCGRSASTTASGGCGNTISPIARPVSSPETSICAKWCSPNRVNKSR